MPNGDILEQDENFVTVDTPTGPFRIARPQAERLGVLPETAIPAAVPEPEPVPEPVGPPAFAGAVPAQVAQQQADLAPEPVFAAQETPQQLGVAEPLAPGAGVPLPAETTDAQLGLAPAEAEAPAFEPVSTEGLAGSALLQAQAANEQARRLQGQLERTQKARREFREDQRRRDELNRVQAESEQRFIESENDRIRKLQEDVNKTKIDRGALLRNMSSGSKIGLLISAAMAGLGSALKGEGDKNPALDVIFDAIDKDVEQQMANLEAKRGNVQAARQLLGDKMGEFKSRRAAAAQMNARALQALQDEFQDLAERAQSENAKVNAQNAVAAARARQEEKEESARRFEVTTGLQRANLRVAQAGLAQRKKEFNLQVIDRIIARGDKLIADAQKAATQQRQVALRDPVTGEVLGIPAHGDPKQTVKDLKVLNDTLGARREIAKLKVSLKQFGRAAPLGLGRLPFLKSQERKNLEGDLSRVRGAVRRALSGAQVNEREMEEIIAQIPDIRGFFERADPSAVLESTINDIDAKYSEFLIGRGISQESIDRSLEAQRLAFETAPLELGEGQATDIVNESMAAALGDNPAEAVEGLEVLAAQPPGALVGQDTLRDLNRATLKLRDAPPDIRRRAERARRDILNKVTDRSKELLLEEAARRLNFNK